MKLRKSSQRERGFTLVELMVAMLGGLFVSIAVFTLAKHASGFSMRQSRIADATLQNVVGFERLKADIARAGYMSTPNLVGDDTVCRDAADPLYPAWLARLASVFIEPVPPGDVSTEASLNGISPQRIVLSGSYGSADQFVARNITESAPVMVYLAPNTLGMANIGYPTNKTAATLARVFAAGRALRIVDDRGNMQFGTIDSVQGGDNPAIQLRAGPALQFRGSSPRSCGIHGHGKNIVNVVNIVRYDIRSLAGLTRFQHMFSDQPSYEATRRELVREELDVDGAPIDGTLELIAEYAVDLGFSLLVAPGDTDPLARLAGADVSRYAGNPVGMLAGNGPQLIRAVHAWLSVRSQEADRTADLSIATSAPGPNLLRISVHPTDGTQGPFARMRTLQSTIPLSNQAKATWR